MKKTIFSILFIASFNLYASAKVSFLSVKNDVVYFSIAADKEQTSPGCVAAENSDLWGVSLLETTGRAMYSIIVTAMAADHEISIETANDCEASAGFERPLEVYVGTRNNLPIGIVTNCNDVLLNDPNAPDGPYSVQPIGTGVLQVYCDMEWDGAWTLVMRAKEMDYANWDTTGFVNKEIIPSPILNVSYKITDELINILKTTVYKVVLDETNVQRFFKGNCIYNHQAKASGDCAKSYADLYWSDPTYNVSSYDYIRGVYDFQYIQTSYRGGWRVGDGENGQNFKYEDGQQIGNGYNYEASFTLWVR